MADDEVLMSRQNREIEPAEEFGLRRICAPEDHPIQAIVGTQRMRK